MEHTHKANWENFHVMQIHQNFLASADLIQISTEDIFKFRQGLPYGQI